MGYNRYCQIFIEDGYAMSVFNIIGPVMIGPSSSHTAGAVRIGAVARRLLGERPVAAVIKLHGSFAGTSKGHGTDRAIVGGLLGMDIADDRLRRSLEIAGAEGFSYTFSNVCLKNAHPNTAVIEVRGESGKSLTVAGASVGGGNIVIKQIEGLEVDFNGQYDTLVIQHRDTPGSVAAVTGALARDSINIAQMKVYRSDRGGFAIMVIETDQPLKKELVEAVRSYPNIIRAAYLQPLY